MIYGSLQLDLIIVLVRTPITRGISSASTYSMGGGAWDPFYNTGYSHRKSVFTLKLVLHVCFTSSVLLSLYYSKDRYDYQVSKSKVS